MTNSLQVLERWLQNRCSDQVLFPRANGSYFVRYCGIRDHLHKEVYPLIGAATSAEDGGIYTDHGPKHFEAVIHHAALLIGLEEDDDGTQKLCVRPYEVFVLLVAILLHDAGNVHGRKDHEKRPYKILRDLGAGLCPDHFEAKIIAGIAEAHGGEVTLPGGAKSKDTIGVLDNTASFGGVTIRPQLIAALVRFADEICEDRSRAARFLLERGELPKKSEVYHAYANSITSVGVDREGKSVNLTIDLRKEDAIKRFGKGSVSGTKEVYLITEIFSRLEKMYKELLYCRRFMYEQVNLTRIRATVKIHGAEMEILKEEIFELKEEGYPEVPPSLAKQHPDWEGKTLKVELESLGGET